MLILMDDINEEVTEKIEDDAEAEESAENKKSEKGKKKIIKKELVKLAEQESLETEEKQYSPLEEKKKELLEKAKKLKEKLDIEKISTEELKEKVKAKKRADMLIPLEEYVKSGIYLGTRVVTPKMKEFVYRRRADGLAIFNTDIIDEKLKEAIVYLAGFNPEDIILVCKRQVGWRT